MLARESNIPPPPAFLSTSALSRSGTLWLTALCLIGLHLLARSLPDDSAALKPLAAHGTGRMGDQPVAGFLGRLWGHGDGDSVRTVDRNLTVFRADDARLIVNFGNHAA